MNKLSYSTKKCNNLHFVKNILSMVVKVKVTTQEKLNLNLSRFKKGEKQKQKNLTGV